jgi:hypothetical protein
MTYFELSEVSKVSEELTVIQSELNSGGKRKSHPRSPANECDFCLLSSDSLFSVACVECKAQLCPKHAINHQESRYTQTHTLVDKAEVENMPDLVDKIASSRNVIRHAETCYYHSPEIAYLICVSCEVPVCFKCAFMQEHKDHKFKPVLEYVAGVKSEYKNHCVLVDKALEAAKNKRQVYAKHLAILQQSLAKEQNHLDKSMEESKKELELKFETQSAKLQMTIQKKCDNLKSVLTKCENQIESYNQAVTKVISAVEKNNPFSLSLVLKKAQTSDAAVVENVEEIPDLTWKDDSKILWTPDKCFDFEEVNCEFSIKAVVVMPNVTFTRITELQTLMGIAMNSCYFPAKSVLKWKCRFCKSVFSVYELQWDHNGVATVEVPNCGSYKHHRLARPFSISIDGESVTLS